MKKIIKTVPNCGDCGGSLELIQIDIDFINCNFVVYGSCIVCGEDNYIILSLEDFIELSQLNLGDNSENKN